MGKITRFHFGFVLAGLLAGVLIGVSVGRITVAPKTVTKSKTVPYHLRVGQSAAVVVSHLGSPVAQTRATATNPFTCFQFVGHFSPGAKAPSDWYAIYCFRTR